MVLDEATIDGFRADGHAAVRGLATAAELDAVRPAILEHGVTKAWDTRPLEERDTYGKAFLQSFNLWRLDPAIEAFVRSPRYAHVAAQLLGCEGVRLYHDQALFKEPGGGHTPWHQDQGYWPMDTDLTITMWMPLVDVPPEIGTMSFASGSHVIPELRGPVISDASQDAFAAAIDELGLPVDTHGPLAAGDATFHAGWTVHSAPPNPTEELRPVMTIIYVADGARVARDLTEVQRFDCKVWLGGRREGELIDHELNPLLWPVPA